MLGRPMVLAGRSAKQVQWTNVYQDALVRVASPRLLCVKHTGRSVFVILRCLIKHCEFIEFVWCGLFTGFGAGGDGYDASFQPHCGRKLSGDAQSMMDQH